MIKITVNKKDGSMTGYETTGAVELHRIGGVPGGTDEGWALNIKETGTEIPLDDEIESIDFDSSAQGTEAADAGL